MSDRERYEREGENSYHRGVGRRECPYDGWRGEAWLLGWDFAWAMDD